jgi:hypothetical protein
MGESDAISRVVALHSSTKDASLNYAAPLQATPKRRDVLQTWIHDLLSYSFSGTKKQSKNREHKRLPNF